MAGLHPYHQRELHCCILIINAYNLFHAIEEPNLKICFHYQYQNRHVSINFSYGGTVCTGCDWLRLCCDNFRAHVCLFVQKIDCLMFDELLLNF